jgi:hypothetical protein
MNERVDMGQFIAPKSDQLNADDLISGPRMITITRVTGNEGNAEQPVNVFYDGDNGKPYRPCKSMRRVMVAVWGRDAANYVGRSLAIYRDPDVQFGGMKVGGIRISHMSHIEERQTMALTAAKARRAPYTVEPLRNAPADNGNGDNRAKAEAWLKGYLANPVDNEKTRKVLAKLEREHPDLYAQTQKPAPSADDDYDSPAPAAAAPSGEASSQPSGDAAGAVRQEDTPSFTPPPDESPDPHRAAADRLIAKAQAGVAFTQKDIADLNGLPEQYRAEVDAACVTA